MQENGEAAVDILFYLNIIFRAILFWIKSGY